MDYNTQKKPSVLIVDDVEMNRFMLYDILCEKFTVYEASNGKEALEIVQQHQTDLSVILLDILMPVMNGYEMLQELNKTGDINNIPVIMISAETDYESVAKAYDLGAIDFINKPFEPRIVERRVANTINLYNKQQSLMGLVVDQVAQQQRTQNLMIGILSHIVETKNGESGLHTLHINMMTRILLNCLIKKTDKYKLTPKDVDLISTASALHDIGKMNIPDEILNKPGRFTPEEFAIMKQHTVLGANTLKELDDCTTEPLMKYSYEICRWHHERYDGRGYPDGLKGDEIPIWAQIVAVADVYDALTAERVYKKAFDPDTAIRMIFNGECGSFNPLILDCLMESQDAIKRELNSKGNANEAEELNKIASEVLKQHPMGLSQKTFNMYHLEKVKNIFYSNHSDGIHFEYSFARKTLILRANKRLGVEERIFENAWENPDLLAIADRYSIAVFLKSTEKATPENPQIKATNTFVHDGEKTEYEMIADVIYDSDSGDKIGVIGKITRK